MSDKTSNNSISVFSMTFRRILVFGQPFNNYSGGGITLTNLFKGWPKEKIAVTYLGHGLLNVTTDVCDIYYQLGKDEHKWKFPFSLFQREFSSGIKSFEDRKDIPLNSAQKGIRHKVVNNYFYPLLRWAGLFHFSTTLSLSEKFKNWLAEFDPEIVYLQVAARDEIVFAKDLIDHLKVPSVIHFMDDWPTTISSRGLFKRYWSHKIEKELKSLLDKVDLHLSISDAMSEEYRKRYKKKFLPFHNPIEVELWAPFTKKDFKMDRKYVNILYSGRIGDNGIAESVVEVASAIDSMKDDGANIKLHIQTPTKDRRIIDKLSRYNCVVFNPFAEYSQIPKIFSGADILLLANDFSSLGLKYLRFSMPTKASEYMISGTPVFVYTPEVAAVSQFFSKNECGYCITVQSREEIVKAIRYLISNEEYRKKISLNAVNLAKERFAAEKVRNEFQKYLVNLVNQDNNVH
jgi:glycosyltransferase involved in cell wall biosynthesis